MKRKTAELASLGDDLLSLADSKPVYFLTNRSNLLEVLSAGFIPTREGFEKYYEDLLGMCPGWVPLLAGPVPAAAIEVVLREEGVAQFPVLLELNPTGFSEGHVETFCATGTDTGASDRLAWAVPHPVALSPAMRLHFRSEEDLNEHRARQYDNIHEDVYEALATPHLFAPDGGAASTAVLGWLHSLPAQDHPDAADYRRVDRLSGARALAAQLVGGDSGALGWLCQYLGGLGSAQTSAGEGDNTAWPSFVELSTLDGRLFQASALVIADEDPDATWRPLEIVERIRAAIGEVEQSAGAELDRNLTGIVGILRTERDFKPFTPGAGLPAAKALLLALLRSDPIRYLSWSSEETGADPAVRTAAGMLIGLLHGRRRLSASLRPRDLDAYLAARATAELASTADPTIVLPAVDIAADEVDGRTTLATINWQGRAIVERRIEGRSVSSLLEQNALDVPPWNTIAVELCRRMRWPELVTTVVENEGGRIATVTVGRKGEVRLSVPGFARVQHQVDAEGLRERLRHERLPEDLERDLEVILSSPEPPDTGASKRTRRSSSSTRRASSR